jgi:phage shock protein A
MKTRWSSLTEIEVIAAYLDPRTKNILSIEETKIAESNLEKEIENMKTKIAATQQQQQQTSTTSTQEQKRYTFLRSYHQISSAREVKPSESTLIVSS